MPEQAFAPIADSMRDLQELYQTGQNLAGQMDSFTDDFQNRYKDFDTFLQEAGGDPAALSEYYGKWADATSESAATAMRSAGMNVNQIGDESARLDELVNQSQTAAGRMQAIQAGNQISGMMVQQLQKMRTMVNDQIQAQGAWQAQVAAEAAAKQAADEKALGGTFENSAPAGY